MAAKYIFAGLALVFLTAGTIRLSRAGWSHPQPRTWLLVGIIFAVVAAWLWV
jgi:hypothetical protein